MARQNALQTDEERWTAVASRDRSADGAFVFAVKTTGVFCRPSCSSRQPNRANVAYFPTPADAERAGYRPCKKCRPAAPVRVPIAIVRACRLLDARPMPLTALADAVGVSCFHLQRIFKEHTGMTPKAYARAGRMKRFVDELAHSPSVTRAMASAGFESTSRLYENVGGDLGMSPSGYRRGGAGMTIRQAIEACDLGYLLVAATARGVCRIELGDTPEELAASLRERFPSAEFVGGDAEFAGWVSQMLALIATPAKACDLPLDVRGTAFQFQVWQALRRIPPGTTATYAEIAARIGRPTAARAVAQACASNPTAVIVPCHRVIGATGKLRGFRWGVERKRALLDKEKQDE